MLRLEKRQRPVNLHKRQLQEYGPSAFTLLLSKHSVSVIFLEETKTIISYVCYFKSSPGGVL